MARGAEPKVEPPPEPIRGRSVQAKSGGRRLGMIAGGSGVALLLILGVWAVRGHHRGVVPVVEAPSGPMRTKPENRGGMQLTGMNDPILSGAGGSEKAALAPPPETPAPKVLRTELEAEKPRAPLPVPPAPRVQEAKPAAPIAPPAVAAARAPEPAPVALAANRPVAAPPAAAAIERPGELMVQFAALNSEAAARTAWHRLSRRMPALLAGRHPTFVRITHDGRVFWRLRTGGFSDREAATQFCAKVRGNGGSCIVSNF